MKKVILLVTAFVSLLILSPVYAVVSTAPHPAESSIDKEEVRKNMEAEWSKLSKKEKKAKRKELRKELKKSLKEARKSGATSSDKLLLVIVAILLPPLAMALYDGISNRFWISLLLTLLFYIPGLIYTLVIILGDK